MKFGPEGHIVQLSCSPLGDLREAIQLNSSSLAPRPRADCRKSGGFHPAGIENTNHFDGQCAQCK